MKVAHEILNMLLLSELSHVFLPLPFLISSAFSYFCDSTHSRDPTLSPRPSAVAAHEADLAEAFLKVLTIPNTPTTHIKMEALSSIDRETYQTLLEPQSTSSASTLILILPPLIRNRLPMLTSIRRRYMRRSISSDIKEADSRPSSSSSTSSSSADGEIVPYNRWEVADKSAKPSRSSSNTSSGTVTPRGPDASGVNWSMAGAGVRLWLTGRQQMEDDRNTDPAVVRSMHIDALKYMHAALPNNLTPAETDAIVGSLPPSVRGELRYQQPVSSRTTSGENNVLRRAVSDSVCSLIAVVIFLLPFLMEMFNRLLRYEREHRVSEKMLSSGVATVNAFGERGLDLKDSRVGSAILETGIWVLDGIVGGVNDGLVRSAGAGKASVQTASQ